MKQRLIIKVGTSSLVDEKSSPSPVFESIAGEIAELSGVYDIALVTSAAIGFGMVAAGMSNKPEKSQQLQVLSCIGQPLLIRHWQHAFKDVAVGQVLLTRRELEDESEESKLKSALNAMWDMGIIPIINENDALTDEQIKVGDNDTLAAHVAIHIGAEILLLLTDVEGVYEKGDSTKRVVREVLLEDARDHITPSVSDLGTGGLLTKLQAGEIAGADVITHIACAREKNIINKSIQGEVGTRLIVQ